jgi:hypothetical protein
MAISFNLSNWLALLICFAATAGVSYFYIVKLRKQRPKLKFALVLLRAAYTLALLLLIFDAEIIRMEQSRSRLLIINRASPLAALPDAGGKTRGDAANDFLSRLSNDSQLARRFAIDRTSESSLTDAALADIAFVDAAQSEAKASAIVCVSDRSEAAIGEAERFSKSAETPLFIALANYDSRIPDVSVASIDSKGAATLDQPQTIAATLAGRNASGRSTLIKLLDEGIVVAQATVHWQENAETISVPLVVVPKVEGLHRYVAKAEPAEGELNTENNELGFSLDVRRGERRALFIESQPTWEGQFIRRALEENASIAIDYFAQVSRAAILGRQQSDIAGRLSSILTDFKKLARYDVIIAGPLEASTISEPEARNIEAFVERRGGGLIILGSNDFNGSIISASSRLAHLSPAIVGLETGSGQQSPQAPKDEKLKDEKTKDEKPIDEKAKTGRTILAPTLEGETLFFNPATSLSVGNLGPLSDSYLRIKALKPGAIALAIDAAERGSEHPVLIAAQEYGYGRAMIVAPSDLWKIQLAEKSENKGAFAALWQNILSWAATNAEPAANIRLRTSAIEAGDALQAYLANRGDDFNPVANVTVRAAIDFEAKEGKGAQMLATVARDPASPGVCEIDAIAGDEGSGNLSVELESQGAPARSFQIAFSVQANKSERREPVDASDRMARAAQATGGGAFDEDQFESLKSKLLELQSEARTSPAVHRLRNSVALAFFLPLLMAAEYFLRRRLIGD